MADRHTFPDSHDGLLLAGYEVLGDARCKGCGAAIVWYRTPKEKSIPIDEDGKQPHWVSCPNRDQFRRSNRQ